MITEAQIKLTGEAIAATMIHMAEQEGVPVETVVALIAKGDTNATTRFDAYMNIARKEVPGVL